MTLRPAVFFDRDGTLIEEAHYCGDPARVKVLPGIPEALQRLKQAGYLIFVITNQSGIGRGLITETQYRAVEAEMLRQAGPGVIDAVYFCPDAPDTGSRRRKPEPAMVFEAAAAHGAELARSFFIGDKADDIECGRRAGVRTILVRTGYGADQQCAPGHTAEDALAAVDWLLQNADR